MKVINNQPTQILMAVVDRNQNPKLLKLLEERHVDLLFLINGKGTARSDILRTFGLSDVDKSVIICILPKQRVRDLMTTIVERFDMIRPGHGILLTLPMTSASMAIARILEPKGDYMEIEKPVSENSKSKYELVMAIVNNGYSEKVMDAARKEGARGGTVIHARQAALTEPSKFFGISLQPEKEFVLIVVEIPIAESVLQAIIKNCGMRTEARGFIMSLPLGKCSGLTLTEQI